MPLVHLKTPWNATVENWEARGLSDAAAFPGLAGDCGVARPGTIPVVHRFLDLFKIKDFPIRFASSSNEFSVMPPDPDCANAWPPCIRAWEVLEPVPLFAVAFEQAWYHMGTTLGELIESLSLTPAEELEIHVFTWDRIKVSRDLESTDIVDKASESSLTRHDSSQVVSRMEKEKEWQLGANVGLSYGVTAGIDFSMGESLSDSIERRREERQEQTNKTTYKLRSERKLKISTVHETGFEEKRRRVLKNPNPTRSVTYNFYETLSHYRVDLAMVETDLAIALPNQLPLITPEWVVCHEGILRGHLLDESQEGGFASARMLVVPGVTNLAKGAIDALVDAFIDMEDAIRSSEGDLLADRDSIGATRANALWIAMRTVLDNQPPIDPSSYLYTRAALETLGTRPSLRGLKHALWMLNGWLWAAGLGDAAYPVSTRLETAIASACSILKLLTSGPGYPPLDRMEGPPGMTGGMSTGEGGTTAGEAPAGETLEAGLVEIEPTMEEATAKDRALFDALKCHIEANLLHYLRPIWLAEDPAVRLRRLADELGFDIAELEQQIVEPMIGFHLNCCVYRMRLGRELEAELRKRLQSKDLSGTMPQPQALQAYLSSSRRRAGECLSRVKTYLRDTAQHRFERNAQTLLDKAVAEAKAHVLTCKRPRKPLSPERVPEVLSLAERIAAEGVKRFEADDGWLAYLTERERAVRSRMKREAETWVAAVETSQSALDENRHSAVFSTQLEALIDAPGQDLKTVMVVLPDGGYHCEPVVGLCSGADPLHARRLEADLMLREAEARQAQLEVDRRERRLESGDLAPEPATPVLTVHMPKPDEN
ncbi:hypothetical protein [Desulfatiglans anilini]|uniref:hypothetical protein n=1 Tax=Desulfatiglans anilini TaxID=90728 RepID=UPI0004096499|nr:hypothetical protein [Desulfatiglans anilini]